MLGEVKQKKVRGKAGAGWEPGRKKGRRVRKACSSQVLGKSSTGFLWLRQSHGEAGKGGEER